MKTFEIEQKYRVQDPLKIRQMLRQFQAKKIRSGAEANELFDLGEMLFAQSGILRLRHYGKQKMGLLTFKGPRLKGRYKKRMEIETCVDWKKVRTLLKAAGFQVVATYSKTREEYALGKSHITLDHLQKNGWFVEIEGNPNEISKLEKKMGFTKKDREERSYLEILGTKVKR